MRAQMLAEDIRRERNVVLQCIRYAVQTDFFARSDDNVALYRPAPPTAAEVEETSQ